MANLPEVTDAKAFLLLLGGAFVAGIFVAVLNKYGIIAQVQRTLTETAGSVRAAA